MRLFFDLDQYAQWLSKSPTIGVLDAAAALSLSSFNQAISTFDGASDLLSEFSTSPFTEASCALRNLLSRAPKRFATHEALATLESEYILLFMFINIHRRTHFLSTYGMIFRRLENYLSISLPRTT